MLKAAIQNWLHPLKQEDLMTILRILGIDIETWDSLCDQAAVTLAEILGLDEILLETLAHFYFNPKKYKGLVDKVIDKHWEHWENVWRSSPKENCPPLSRLQTLIEAIRNGNMEWEDTLQHIRDCEHCARLCVWLIQKQRDKHLCSGDCMLCPVMTMCPEMM